MKRKGIVITTVKGKKRRVGVRGYKRRRPKVMDKYHKQPLWLRIKKKWWKLQWRFSNWRKNKKEWKAATEKTIEEHNNLLKKLAE